MIKLQPLNQKDAEIIKLLCILFIEMKKRTKKKIINIFVIIFIVGMVASSFITAFFYL
ncbi:hypothetical protein KKD03_04605 [Patescibacteria group bacterium]|nr:hypothetical protein [Patescibacteria group bacterium]